MEMILRLMMISLALAFFVTGKAAIWYVDVANGSDNNDGIQSAPFKTTAKAISRALAGDTVLIVKVDFPIHESITIIDKSGEAGLPIVIDGQGNLFTGAEKLRPEEWRSVRPGIYRNDHLLRGLKPGSPSTEATMMRFFLAWNGQLNRMGRSCNGMLAPFVLPQNLKSGEWTYVDSETAFYIAITPGEKLEDQHIEIPMRQNGVAIAGTCKHWVIRNINIQHVINDGFNIHGHTEDVVFDHITATECGDDGISAHEDCTIRIHDFVARRNSTGLCHGDYNVTCVADSLVLEENYGYNLLLSNGTDTFSNCIISAVIPPGGMGGIGLKNRPVTGSPKQLAVTFNNCHFPFSGKPASNDKAPSFTSEDGVRLTMSKDCKLDGDILFLPPRKLN